MVKITTNNNMEINNIEFNGKFTVEITNNIIKLTEGCFYDFAKCSIKKIKTLICDNTTIIKNGKILIECNDCKECPMCKKINLSIPTLNPGTSTREEGYYCGKNETYSDNLSNLKKSKIKSKGDIEYKKCYQNIEEHFKRRREKYITNETLKRIIKSIDNCLNAEYGTYNEYGHEIVMLESINIYENKYGYKLTHDGRIGDDGWYVTIYIHKKCNIRKLEIELRKKYGNCVENNIEVK